MLKRNLAKHNPGVDLENLDFEVVDKEMEPEEANTAGDTADVGAGDGGDNMLLEFF